jgi:hypothetical protein
MTVSLIVMMFFMAGAMFLLLIIVIMLCVIDLYTLILQTYSILFCTSCVTIHFSLLSSLYAALSFLPASPLPLSPPLLVPSPYISSPPLVVSSLSSYIFIQNFYFGSPNFISKVALVASHINFQLLGELSQGFHDTQILDLIHYGWISHLFFQILPPPITGRL